MDRTQATFGPPQLTQFPVRYEIAEKNQAVAHGGLALIHTIILQTGLYDALNSVPVLKHHLPYWEADHLLNIAYNFLCGGTALEHIAEVNYRPTKCRKEERLVILRKTISVKRGQKLLFIT